MKYALMIVLLVLTSIASYRIGIRDGTLQQVTLTDTRLPDGVKGTPFYWDYFPKTHTLEVTIGKFRDDARVIDEQTFGPTDAVGAGKK